MDAILLKHKVNKSQTLWINRLSYVHCMFFVIIRKNHASQTEVSSDGLSATKTNPQKDYAGGVVYSEKPLQGTCEFEVEMTKYGTGWSGNLKLGITLVGKNEGPPKVVPRYSPEGNEVCVWCDSKLFDRIIKRNEKVYGKKRLDDLREGDRLGLQITKDGTLSFFINGKHQGIALCDVYKPDHDVYAIVDHYGNAISTTITKSGNEIVSSVYISQLHVVHIHINVVYIHDICICV